MDSGKLVTCDDEFDVYICDECSEHEAQVRVMNGMICFQCWCSRNERYDSDMFSPTDWRDSCSEEEVFNQKTVYKKVTGQVPKKLGGRNE